MQGLQLEVALIPHEYVCAQRKLEQGPQSFFTIDVDFESFDDSVRPEWQRGNDRVFPGQCATEEFGLEATAGMYPIRASCFWYHATAGGSAA